MFRDNLLQYGRSYLNSDFELKDNGHFKISQFPLILDFEYNNLRHAPIQIDMS